MGLFKEENLEIKVNLEVKLLPAFKKIYTRDHNKYKRKATRDFLFIYHMADYQSPYANYPEREREKRIISDFKIDEEGYPDKDLLHAVDFYKELNFTPSIKTLNEMMETLHTSNNIIKALREDLEDKLGSEDKNVDDLLSKLDSLLKVAEKLPKNIDNIDKVKEKIQIEQSRGNRVKGNVEINEFEK